MIPDSEAPAADGAVREEIERLTAVGTAATRRGEFADALAAFEEALSLARSAGRSEDIEKGALNVAMVRMQSGEAKRAEEGLREILLRTQDARIGFTAAYHLASSLRRQGRLERALSYAQRALERAEAEREPDLLAPVHNLLGNILLAQSYPDRALEYYETALRIRESQEEDTRWSEAILRENIGYCLILGGNIDPGIETIVRALDVAEEIGDRRCRAECLQDLCYGHLLRDRYAEALEFGAKALEEARVAGYRDIEENCHYLLGEIGTRTGDAARRDAHFEALQQMHPELPFLLDFLCAVDVMGLITLKR